MGVHDGSIKSSNATSHHILRYGDSWDSKHLRISNVTNPNNNHDAVNKVYADGQYLNKVSGGSIQSNVNMNNNDLFGINNNQLATLAP